VGADGVVQPFVDTIPVPGPEGGAAAEGEARDGRRRRRRGNRDRGEGRGGEEGVQALVSDDGAAVAEGRETAAPEGAAAPGAEATGEPGAERERGRRRGRGGRDRDRDGNREPREPRGDALADGQAPAGDAASAEADETPPMAVAAVPVAATAAATVDLMAPADAPAEPAIAPVVAPLAAAAPTPAPAPVRVEPYHLPTDDLAALATSAGLQWVQSDADKISAVQAAMVAEPAPVRVPREPRRHVLVDDGPLVLVETKKDLSQLKLPFEQQQPSA
jgi:ribonuclease E